MKQTYKIVEILNRDGGPRMDKFYPELIGKYIKFPYGLPSKAGEEIYGEINGQYIRSSCIEEIEVDSGLITVTTKNTIYKFKIIL